MTGIAIIHILICYHCGNSRALSLNDIRQSAGILPKCTGNRQRRRLVLRGAKHILCSIMPANYKDGHAGVKFAVEA